MCIRDRGWELPTTWDEMWELGDKAKAEGISLFTYPTTGYFDAFFYALMYTCLLYTSSVTVFSSL